MEIVYIIAFFAFIWLAYRLFHYLLGQHYLKTKPIKSSSVAFMVAKKQQGDYYSVESANDGHFYHCRMPMYKFNVYFTDQYDNKKRKLAKEFYVCADKKCTLMYSKSINGHGVDKIYN